MRVSNLRAQGVCGFIEPMELVLPETGIVLVIGPNGGGKSSIVEIVPSALYGKTLRGASPWVAPTAEARVVLRASHGSDVTITHRTREGGRVHLDWSAGGKTNAVQYESTKHAQDALDRVVPSFDLWRRACVFSSDDPFRFSVATDSERKRFLEEALLLGRLDEASVRARQGGSAARSRLAAASAASQASAQTVGALRAQHAAVEGDPGDMGALEAELGRATAVRGLVGEELSAALQTTRAAERVMEDLDRELARVLNRQGRVLVATCPACEQPVPADRKAALERELRGEEWGVRGKLGTAREEVQRQREAYSRLAADDAQLRSLAETLAAGLGRARSLQAKRDAVGESIAQADARLVSALAEEEAARADLAVWEEVEELYGMRGVRGRLLSEALAALTHSANRWLGRLAGDGVTLDVTSTSETSSGRTAEKIGFELRGFGGEAGYRGASQGQQRRVDVAMMLATAEVISQDPHSTLWFDEVVDSLDHEGIAAANAVLEELGRTRCVVVITHNEELARGLRAARHIRVENGRLHE